MMSSYDIEVISSECMTISCHLLVHLNDMQRVPPCIWMYEDVNYLKHVFIDLYAHVRVVEFLISQHVVLFP
jgi:hypothetical protein